VISAGQSAFFFNGLLGVPQEPVEDGDQDGLQ
jgi:hypothetical protein